MNFEQVKNYLFDSVIFVLMFYKQDKNKQLANVKPKKEDAQTILGDDLFFDLLEIEFQTFLDKMLFSFFDHCFKLNEVISKYGYFLKFFERCNVHRFLIKKKVQGKMRSQEIYLLVSLKCLMDMK